MGNSHTSSENVICHNTNPNFTVMKEDITFKKTKKDARLGEVDELEHNATKDVILKKDIIIEDNSLLTEDNLRKLKARVHLNHENLAQIYGFEINVNPEDLTKLSVLFESFASDAATEFRIRSKKQNFFDEEELYSSLLACLQVLHYLESHRISHGNVTPNAIVMSAEGDIKMLDHSFLQYEHSNYEACVDGAQSYYLAPELLALLPNAGAASLDSINANKADVFSLGMVFIYAALLEEPAECYDWDNYSFNTSKLYDHYEKVRSRYKGPFANVLQHLIKVDASQRPDFRSLMANIDHYQKHDSYIRDPKYSTPVYPLTENEHKTLENKGYTPNTNHSYPTTIQKNEFNSKSYSFVDPKVQEIIREAKEKNWIKSSVASTASKYSSQTQNYTKPINWGSGSTLRYSSAFAETYLSPNATNLRNDKQETSNAKNTYDPSKYMFNTPQVNEIIAQIRNSDRYSPSTGFSKVFGLTTPTKALFKEDDKIISPYSTEKTWYKTTSISPTKKTRDTAEIIKELREKYGSKQSSALKKNDYQMDKEILDMSSPDTILNRVQSHADEVNITNLKVLNL